MKENIKFITIPLLITIFISLAFTQTFAAEINSNPANVGDTVTYELRVNPCPNKIQALDAVIYYDSNSLEYVPYSLELPNISGFMTNTNIIGEIRFNAMDFVGFDFDEDKILSTVQFTVKDTAAQELNLTYEIKTFIDSTSTDLGSTYTYDVTSVNGGVDRNTQNDTDSVSSIYSDTLSSTVSTDSDDLLNGSDTDTNSDEISSDIYDTDTNTDTDSNNVYDTDTAADSDSEIVDNFDEFLTEINSEASSVNESTVSSKPANENRPNNTKLYIIAFSVAIAAILVIGIIFKAISKRSDNGSHFS